MVLYGMEITLNVVIYTTKWSPLGSHALVLVEAVSVRELCGKCIHHELVVSLVPDLQVRRGGGGGWGGEGEEGGGGGGVGLLFCLLKRSPHQTK